jgi:SAM-dependent methyltransferase
MATRSVEELNASAEHYFARVSNWNYHLAKPFAMLDEAPELLIHVAKVLQGLQLLSDHRVLDFGAGSCWTSYWLTQLGCEVYALDVSPTALRIGARLFELHPVIGDLHPPRFLHFDGHRIPLDDASVDRILCFDAFHHLANPAEALREMARVLAPGGIAAFSEPGPTHSQSPQSQFEMQHFGVVENDIVIEDIWTSAQQAGFTGIELTVFDAGLCRVSLEEFNRFLVGDSATIAKVVDAIRGCATNHRTFFLSKGSPPPTDSRRRSGLVGELGVQLDKCASGQAHLRGRAHVKNTSPHIWLPASVRVGAVRLGCHLLDDEERSIEEDFFRATLTPGLGWPLRPGDEVDLDLAVPIPPPGRYVLEFDLVSEYVCWFAVNGSSTVKVSVEVD